MPLGAFIANKKLMRNLAKDPALGHITTFGGHPVCCAAGMAAMKVLLKEKLHDSVHFKEQLFHQLLQHPKIKAIRSNGLLLALEFDNFEISKKIVDQCINATDGSRVLTDWFLFAPECMRIAPPLTISKKEIRKASSTICAMIDSVF